MLVMLDETGFITSNGSGVYDSNPRSQQGGCELGWELW